MTAGVVFCVVAWLAVGGVAAIDMRRRGQRGWWFAVCVLVGGFAGAAYWAAGRARSEVERRDQRDGAGE